MKIIQVIYSLSSGGAEKFVVDLSNQLARMGHQVTVCMLLKDTNPNQVFNKQFLINKVKFHSMQFDARFSLAKVWKVENFIKSSSPDIVHCHLNVIPYIFRLSLFNKNIKFFHTLHSVTAHAKGALYQRLLNKYFYKNGIIRPICISKLCLDSYKEFYHLDNAALIENGRSMMDKSNTFSIVQKEVQDLKINDNCMVFIHVARCSKEKNQKLLIEAFNKLRDKIENFVLLIIGSGYDNDFGIQLRQIACGNIYFLGVKNNVNDYLYCSDAFCMTSLYEGLPISLLEALSCGVTPICTPVGGIPDVIKDAQNGYLSAGLTIDEYVEAIQRFMLHPLEKSHLIKFYQQHYSMEICAKKYETLYKENKIVIQFKR